MYRRNLILGVIATSMTYHRNRANKPREAKHAYDAQNRDTNRTWQSGG
jgi:hypothetical protein